MKTRHGGDKGRAGQSSLLSGYTRQYGKQAVVEYASHAPPNLPPSRGEEVLFSRFNNFPLPLRWGRAGVGVTPLPPQAVRHGVFDLLSCDHPLGSNTLQTKPDSLQV